jgi:hypothetical protein
MLIIFVTIFEIPYFIRRMHLLRTRWELEGELLLHFLLNVDQPADLALLEVHSVPVPVSATVSASIEPQLDEEHATVATLSEEDLSTSSQVADSNCCSLTSAWISAFLNGSDFSESNGPCAFHGWLGNLIYSVNCPVFLLTSHHFIPGQRITPIQFLLRRRSKLCLSNATKALTDSNLATLMVSTPSSIATNDLCWPATRGFDQSALVRPIWIIHSRLVSIQF